MKIKVEEYLLENGDSPYRKWFAALNAQAAAKVVTAKLRLEMGNTSSVKWFAGIGEYVIDWGPGYRIYLAKDGEQLIILFGGGTKRIQQRDIDQAKKLHLTQINLVKVCIVCCRLMEIQLWIIYPLFLARFANVLKLVLRLIQCRYVSVRNP